MNTTTSSTPRQGKRIGLFGGSFDPVHCAHVAVAKVALAQLQLDEVRWIPAGQPWQKSRHLTPAQHREAMVRLAIQGIAGCVLDRTELRRNGPSFTLDTVRELQAADALAGGQGTEWFLILGQDQYASLHTWRDWRELLGLVTLAVACRPDAPATARPEVAAFARRSVDLPMTDISSSDIRARIESGQAADGLVPAEVAGYIEQHGLYRSAASDTPT